MKPTLLLLATAIIAMGAIQSCKKKKSATTVTESVSAEPNQNSQSELKVNGVNISPTYVWPGMIDPYTIESTSIKGDTLFVVVNYGGGCEKHHFTMYTNMMWMKSNPPQLNLYIEHNANGDKCRAMIQETLAFQLGSLRYKEKGAVRFIINDNREGSVLYEY